MLSRAEEAHYGYLAAVNSTTLSDGVALDIGGGSMQLTQVAGRRARSAQSWRLGAVVTTERFFPAERVKPKQVKALREHVRDELRSAPWLPGAPGRLAGIGGTVRNLAARDDDRGGPADVRRPGLLRCAARRSTRWSSGSPS